MTWSAAFDDPIPLPRGDLVTLEDAARYIQKLPKADQELEEWRTAVENLIKAAETGGGWLMLARIGMMRALNRDRPEPEREPRTRRKRAKAYKIIR